MCVCVCFFVLYELCFLNESHWIELMPMSVRLTVANWHSQTATRTRTATWRCSPTLPKALRPTTRFHTRTRSASTSSTTCARTRHVAWCHRSTSCLWRRTGADVAATRRPMAEPVSMELWLPLSGSDELCHDALVTWGRLLTRLCLGI